MSSPYSPPAAETRLESPEAKPAHQKIIDGPVGIGGWLILPMIGMVLTPFQMLGTLARDYVPIFRDGNWEYLTTPGSEAYHELWAVTLIFEIATYLIIAVLAVAAFVLAILKSEHTPRTFIGLYIFDAVTTIVALVLSSQLPVDEEVQGATGLIVFTSLVKNLIWIGYFRNSRRVKNTFTRG